MAVARLQTDIGRNSTAIGNVNANLTTVGRDVSRLRKDAADRRKEIAGVKNSLSQTTDAVVMLPILQTALGANNPQLTELLPLLLLGGLGTSPGTDGSMASGMFDNNMMMMLLLVLAIGK